MCSMAVFISVDARVRLHFVRFLDGISRFLFTAIAERLVRMAAYRIMNNINIHGSLPVFFGMQDHNNVCFC